MKRAFDSSRRQLILAAGASLVPVALMGRIGSAAAAPRAQAGLYPSYNGNPIAPDSTGMTSTAAQLARRIRLGWNIGNTMEAIGGETAWGNPLVTGDLIKFVKASGFDSIRIPCSWDQHADKATAKISDAWLNRVKQVVQYCMDADMPVLLNIHWDGGWLDGHINAADAESVVAKQRAFWEQIASHMRDFDERLMFASANEPPADKVEQMPILFRYHQTFIDTVRSTGGKNAYRVLVLQGPSTDIDKTYATWDHMPTDTVADRLMVEVHYYTPSQFTLLNEDASWGKMFYFWGKDNHSAAHPERNPTWGEEKTVDEAMAKMKSKFADKGIPVILGEFDAMHRANLSGDDLKLNQASRASYLRYVTRQALANGLLPFYWDAGGGVIDRKKLAILDRQGIDALLEGAGKK